MFAGCQMSAQALNFICNILRLNQDLMGNEQPKPIAKVTKAQIDIAALKARIHLELYRDRKNSEVVKVQKELIAKIKNKSRNKTEEILIAERVILGLKYATACNLLIGYASNIRLQAQFISENMFNPQKMEPFMVMIYSLIYAADHLGLSSLAEFKNLMRALNNPIALEKYVNPQIVSALAPTPTAEELNIYMLQFSQRNAIPLQEINAGGHKFTKEWKSIPSIPPNNNLPSNFTEIEKRLAEDLKNKFGGPGGFGDPNNKGGVGGFGDPNNKGGVGGFGDPNNKGVIGGFGEPINKGGIGGFNPYQNLDPKQFINNGANNNFNQPNPYTNPNNNYNFGPNGNNGNTANNTPANLGPNIYVPPEITPKNKAQQVRQSITSLNDIDYYPQIDANPIAFNKGGFSDPDFDKICERLKKGL